MLASNTAQSLCRNCTTNEDRSISELSTRTKYTYDGTGIRVKKTYGGVTTTYLFSGTKPIAEYVGGAVTKEYIYSGEHQLAEISYSGVNYSINYKYPDHLSTRVETDSAGNVTRTFGHIPYGETWYETGTSSKWKFTTYERDSDTNNDYATFRHYENRLGRFMTTDPYSGSTDPLVPQTWNKFAYVRNDPTTFYDPTGLCGEGMYFAYWEEGYVNNRTYHEIWVPFGPPCNSGGVGAGNRGNRILLPTPDEGGAGAGAGTIEGYQNCTEQGDRNVAKDLKEFDANREKRIMNGLENGAIIGAISGAARGGIGGLVGGGWPGALVGAAWGAGQGILTSTAAEPGKRFLFKTVDTLLTQGACVKNLVF